MIRIRSCADMDEMQACVQLQIETWGYDETDVIPRKTFMLAQKIGGQVIGAFDSEVGSAASAPDGMLVGFAMSLPGIKSTREGPLPYIHSHMLAVRSSHRNRGLGAQLKWHQRSEALARGIRHMEWTFDPLEIKNAYFNIHSLGAVARHYHVNFYGVSSSRLQGGLPTDRLLAEWELDSPRVHAKLGRRSNSAPAIHQRIVVPVAVAQWKAGDSTRDRALAVQIEMQQRFQYAFSHGLIVADFSLDASGNGVYELSTDSQL